MTSEERFTKIENAIQALTEIQARHETQIEKQNAGIRDLIVLNRAFLDSQKEVTAQIQGITIQLQGITIQIQELREAQKHTDAQIQELREAQKHTDETLTTLIDTIDRMIRSRNGRGDKG